MYGLKIFAKTKRQSKQFSRKYQTPIFVPAVSLTKGNFQKYLVYSEALYLHLKLKKVKTVSHFTYDLVAECLYADYLWIFAENLNSQEVGISRICCLSLKSLLLENLSKLLSVKYVFTELLACGEISRSAWCRKGLNRLLIYYWIYSYIY